MGKQVDAGFFLWGCSSVGRAPALQAGGQEFESLHLHLRERKPKAFERTLRSSETRTACTLKTAY